MQKVFLYFLAGKSNKTNAASAMIDVRCGYFVGAKIGFRIMRSDPVERLMTAN
jgi:hypothetical protein